MGVRAREIAVSEFAVERIVSETMHVYRSLLGRACFPDARAQLESVVGD